MEKIEDHGVVFGALLTDFSKVLDCISHDRNITKLVSKGFHVDTLKLFTTI